MSEENEVIEEPEEEVSRTFTVAVALMVFVLIVAIVLWVGSEFGSEFGTPQYANKTEFMGVPIHSNMPLEELKNKKIIYLAKNSGKAATTCNFEIAAVSEVKNIGYKVYIEEGETGLYLGRDTAYIRGETEEDILQSCHAFVCLKEEINCSKDMNKVVDSILEKRVANVILGENITGAGLRGPGEVLGALGYLQASKIVDLDGNGKLDRWEIEKNLIVIMQYIQENDTCKLQPITNKFQKYNKTNETAPCYILNPSIRFVKSDKNQIRVEGNDIILEGDDEHLNTESIIVRDVISPEFVRKLYGRD